jgi:hypothetical protein
MDNAQNTPKRDHRWQSIFENVPSDLLSNLAKTRKGYKLENLTKGQEALVDEVFRVCDSKTLDLLYAQFSGLDGPVWYYVPKSHITKRAAMDAMRKNTYPSLPQDGVEPDIGPKPLLYRVEERTDAVLFHFAAKDTVQNIRTGFEKRTTIEVMNLYTAVLHFSDPRLVVVGPYTAEKANAVVAEFQENIKPEVAWECVKAKRGLRRAFYDALKAALKANLIDTKRHDPSGDYETVALESRMKHPDLENVPSFRKQYLDADSIYDVLEFRFANPIGLEEKTHVKFGSPAGRFSFRARTSLAAIYHFETLVYGVLL